MYAIAQAAPGPNVLVVTLIGWQVAGLAGALIATLAMCLPMSVVTCSSATGTASRARAGSVPCSSAWRRWRWD